VARPHNGRLGKEDIRTHSRRTPFRIGQSFEENRLAKR
jgi:hypothetical protein